MSQCQLMRHTTAVGICWQQGGEEGGDVSVVVLRLCWPARTGNAVAWAVLYSGLVECVCMWVLTENLCP